MAQRKKLAEMTPFERVESRLKGLTNEEAEDVAMTILANLFIKHTYVLKDGEEWLKQLIPKLGEKAMQITSSLQEEKR